MNVRAGSVRKVGIQVVLLGALGLPLVSPAYPPCVPIGYLFFGDKSDQSLKLAVRPAAICAPYADPGFDVLSEGTAHLTRHVSYSDGIRGAAEVVLRHLAKWLCSPSSDSQYHL